MALEITEEEDEDSYLIINKEAQKAKIRQLLKHQKERYNSSSSSTSTSSCSSYSLSSTGVALRSSSSSINKDQSRKLLNLMKKGSRSLRRLFDMEHTSLSNHFEFYSGSSETKTIPLWGSDSDDGVHDDPWMGITKFDYGFIREPEVYQEEHQEHEEQEEHHDEHEQYKESVFRKQKLTRKKSFTKLPTFYKFRFRFRFRLKLRFRFCSQVLKRKKRNYM